MHCFCPASGICYSYSLTSAKLCKTCSSSAGCCRLLCTERQPCWLTINPYSGIWYVLWLFVGVMNWILALPSGIWGTSGFWIPAKHKTTPWTSFFNTELSDFHPLALQKFWGKTGWAEDSLILTFCGLWFYVTLPRSPGTRYRNSYSLLPLYRICIPGNSGCGWQLNPLPPFYGFYT